ncbi:hypothetical protein BpHYR1_051973 [Brachionus plicatilis]|uniref:Uncharacterized protein n=1 Tax=Brachionus plicatilis TaxID=10195 RepID=A0A3M7SDI0_BRAPC|nr:hypothetical protein BpHYR1_051973 [Brachionus plicatilis]
MIKIVKKYKYMQKSNPKQLHLALPTKIIAFLFPLELMQFTKNRNDKPVLTSFGQLKLSWLHLKL